MFHNPPPQITGLLDILTKNPQSTNNLWIIVTVDKKAESIAYCYYYSDFYHKFLFVQVKSSRPDVLLLFLCIGSSKSDSFNWPDLAGNIELVSVKLKQTRPGVCIVVVSLYGFNMFSLYLYGYWASMMLSPSLHTYFFSQGWPPPPPDPTHHLLVQISS